MRSLKQPIVRYLLAALATVAALFLRGLLDPFLGSDNPYHTVWLAIVFASWYCGIGPSMVSVAISVLGVWYWFLPPARSFSGMTWPQFYGMIGFLVLSAVIIAFGESNRRMMAKRQDAEAALRRAHDELEHHVKQRTSALEHQSAALAEQAAMLDLANDAIFVRTSTDIISYWNQGAERLYGWTKEQILGRSPHDLLRTEFPVPLEEIKRKETWEGELRHTCRDGRRILVASRWTALRDPSGNAIGWLEINTDITSRKHAEQAARSLSGRILTLQDEERRRIARELHDSLGQYLAALKMNLDSLPTANGDQLQIIADCADIVDRCLRETRTISHLLHPPLLDESGLDSAARWYIDEFARRSGITVHFDVSPERLRLQSEIEIALFRAIQEGLTNVHRHSGASTVDICLALDGDRARLEIRDNGRGIPQEQLKRLVMGATRSGVGLAGMRERLRELNGILEIYSDQTGTTLVAVTPASITPAASHPLVA